ncbi:MAG: type IV pilus secretin PilQ [Nitrospirae bacterium]|nr:type IV pilus secretin PilQ [Nitrospirota bacterium]
MNQKLYIKNEMLKNIRLSRVAYIIFLCSMLLIFYGCATTQAGKETLKAPEPVKIVAINIQDNQVTITGNKPFIYTIYKPDDPYKIVIDLPDVSIGNFKQKIISSKKGISELTPSQIETPSLMARLELLLDTPATIDHIYKNSVLTVTVKEEGIKKELPAPKVSEIKTEIKEEKEDMPLIQPLPEATAITELSFESTEDAIKFIIKGNGSMIPNVFPLDNRIVIDIYNVEMNAQIPSEVVSPVKGVRAGKHEDKIRLVLDLKEDTNFDVSSIGDSIVLTLLGTVMEASPLVSIEAEKEKTLSRPLKEEAAMVGSKCYSYLEGKEVVNFDFQDQDIVPIFRLFADISGCNLFIHPDVKGKATMKFRDVPWNQAFDTILKTFSLGKSVEGNVIRIAPHTIFAKESEEKVKAEEAGMKAEALETRVFEISYADVAIVENAIRNAKLISQRGSINVDKRTSTMIVKDIASVFPGIEEILKTLDKPTPQVLVEARIVEVNTATTKDLGIQWGINYQSSNTLLSAGGLSGVPLLSEGPFTGGNYLVDFPAKNVGALSGSGFTFGILDPSRTIGLDFQLSAIETVGKGKVISNPKILTIDNGKAKILQGKSIPVRRLTTEGTVSTEFKDVTLELVVTPHITPDGSISMELNLKKEELDPSVPSVEGVPGTDKKEANTNVIIKDGETVVIGGMYKIQTSEQDSGVPGLMNIPILGWLFKNRLNQSNTSELLIFITPRIVEKP